jgi:hypothetical protein
MRCEVVVVYLVVSSGFVDLICIKCKNFVNIPLDLGEDG